MVDNQNTNPQTPATDAAASTAQAPGLDLSGLGATMNTFAKPKGNEDRKKIDFTVDAGSAEKQQVMKDAAFERDFFKRITRVGVVALVLLICAFLGYVFQQYLRYVEGKPLPAMVAYYMPEVHQGYLYLAGLFGQDPDAYNPNGLISPQAQQTLNAIVTDRSMNYVIKKEVLSKSVAQLANDTIMQYSKLDEVKQDIGSYGFFPKDVQLFAQSTFVDNSLQSSLLAVEAIRFSTALTFFSNLDTFIQQFSSFISLNPSQVSNILKEYKERSEKDIQNYLTTCYFNPYVSADACSMPQGNDFLNYYTYVDDKATIDKRVFPVLMNYLDAKLENSDFPSLEINIKSFDPVQNNISFTIELNTFQEDELQLLNKGILNPHIYLATKIINLLRESKFVVAEPINLNSLKVLKKKMRVGSQEYTVSNSSFDFILPLQKNAQREIYDYDQKQ